MSEQSTNVLCERFYNNSNRYNLLQQSNNDVKMVNPETGRYIRIAPSPPNPKYNTLLNRCQGVENEFLNAPIENGVPRGLSPPTRVGQLISAQLERVWRNYLSNNVMWESPSVNLINHATTLARLQQRLDTLLAENQEHSLSTYDAYTHANRRRNRNRNTLAPVTDFRRNPTATAIENTTDATDVSQPRQPTTPPRQQATSPRQQATSPRQQATSPRQPTTPPRQQATPQGHQATPPMQPTTPPRQQATPPRQQATPPRQQATPPRQQATPPGHQATPPGQQTTPPRQQATSVGQRGEQLINQLITINIHLEQFRDTDQMLANYRNESRDLMAQYESVHSFIPDLLRACQEVEGNFARILTRNFDQIFDASSHSGITQTTKRYAANINNTLFHILTEYAAQLIELGEAVPDEVRQKIDHLMEHRSDIQGPNNPMFNDLKATLREGMQSSAVIQQMNLNNSRAQNIINEVESRSKIKSNSNSTDPVDNIQVCSDRFNVIHDMPNQHREFKRFATVMRRICNRVLQKTSMNERNRLTTLNNHLLQQFASRRLNSNTIQLDRSQIMKTLYQKSNTQRFTLHDIANNISSRTNSFSFRLRGEPGIDAGGISNEVYSILEQIINNDENAIFVPIRSDSILFKPNARVNLARFGIRTTPNNINKFYSFIGALTFSFIRSGYKLKYKLSNVILSHMMYKNITDDERMFYVLNDFDLFDSVSSIMMMAPDTDLSMLALSYTENNQETDVETPADYIKYLHFESVERVNELLNDNAVKAFMTGFMSAASSPEVFRSKLANTIIANNANGNYLNRVMRIYDMNLLLSVDYITPQLIRERIVEPRQNSLRSNISDHNLENSYLLDFFIRMITDKESYPVQYAQDMKQRNPQKDYPLSWEAFIEKLLIYWTANKNVVIQNPNFRYKLSGIPHSMAIVSHTCFQNIEIGMNIVANYPEDERYPQFVKMFIDEVTLATNFNAA